MAQDDDTNMQAPPVVQGVSVVLRRNGRFLLVLRKYEPAKGLYAFPGGKTRTGEDSSDAARREILEETGLMVSRLVHLRDLEIDLPGPAARSVRLTVFAGEDPGGEAVAADDAAALGWFSVEDMDDLPMTRSSLELARELAAADELPLASRQCRNRTPRMES